MAQRPIARAVRCRRRCFKNRRSACGYGRWTFGFDQE